MQWLKGALFSSFVKIIQATPKEKLQKRAYFLGNLAYKCDIFRKKIVLKNLAIAFPKLSQKERNKIAQKMYQNFAFYLSDLIKSNNITLQELEEKVVIEGKKNLEKALQNQKPIVFMTAHFGNWELPAKIIGAKYIPMIIIMREFENKTIGAFFSKSRSLFGIIPVNKQNAAKEIFKAFKTKKSVGILIDQHSNSPKALEVKFFGKKVKFNRSITTLAQKFQAQIVPIFSYYSNGKYILEILEPKSFSKEDTPQSFTQWQATTIEEMIKKHPSQYYWFHKRFKNIKGIYD